MTAPTLLSLWRWRSKDKHAVVPGVGHVQPAVRGGREPGRQLHRAEIIAARPPNRKNLPFVRELDNPVALGIGCVHVALLVHSEEGLVDDRLRIPTLDRPLLDRLELFVKLLYALVPCVGHVDVSLGVDADADRLEELAGIAAGAAKRAKRVALRVEFQDSLVASVRDPEIAVRINGNGTRAVELIGA